ncbi:hypothetical protein KAR91_77415 [Candidatus Pacearchaeota archaeon]|nr:hypothetical protein [Candidatus Pacearchaeota archaeon]
MLIEDGQGTGKKMGVNDANRGLVEAISSTKEHNANHQDGEAYNALFSQSPTANDDCIFYMANDKDITMVIEGITLSVSGACEVYFQINDKGSRNSVTEITPTNLNAGSTNSADATVEQGADLDGAAATIAGGTEFQRYVFTAAAGSNHFNFEQDLVLTKNATITIWCNDSTVTVTGTVEFNFQDEDQ